MNERNDIQFGQAFTDNIQDDDGYVDLTGATVVIQYRVECGDLAPDLAATITDADTGAVSVSGIPVGQYQIRWKVTIGADTTYYPDYGWDNLTVRAVDACKTFDIFVSNIAETVFPEGEAENLLANHRKYVVDSLIDLQQKVPCLRVQHRDRRSMSDTFLECGASVIDAPRGFIHSIYAVTQDNCCQKRYFDPVDHDEMIQFLADNQNCGTLLEPTYYYYLEDYGYLDYPSYGCLYYADSSGETDAACRPGTSYVSMKNGLLYLFPWLQSNEVLVIEWDGVKRSWRDTDEVTWDREVQDAVEHFLASKAALREDADLQKVQAERAFYDESVRKQIWQCRSERRIERRRHYFSNCGDFANASRNQAARSNDGGGSSIQMNDCTVENYAELRLLNPPPCESVKVLGYATAFDGGGGIFIRKINSPAQTDNNGDIVVSTTNSAYYWRKWL